MRGPLAGFSSAAEKYDQMGGEGLPSVKSEPVNHASYDQTGGDSNVDLE
jgi:hypothetical protein